LGATSFVDLNLSGADFSAAIDLKNVDFRGAKLWATNFTWAQLQGANFNGVDLADYTSFGYGDSAWDTRLIKARSNDEEAAWWNDERFRYITNFDNAVLVDAQFQNSGVTGVSFRNAMLTGTHFEHSDLSRSDFTGAKDLDKAHFVGACYGGASEKPVGLPNSILAKLQEWCQR
jgi:uncharacterized protein YjbI with pentapeptide repeats